MIRKKIFKKSFKKLSEFIVKICVWNSFLIRVHSRDSWANSFLLFAYFAFGLVK